MKTKKVDLTFVLVGADGNLFQDQNGNLIHETAGASLGRILAAGVSTEESKIIKHFEWARQLCTHGYLELDKGDCIELKKFIVDSKVLFDGPKAQMLPQFEFKSDPVVKA